MIRISIEGRGVSNPSVLKAMREVPRHKFVPRKIVPRAYADRAFPIGDGQPISQPYVVALMTASLNHSGRHRVPEIGAGSGYQWAVLAKIVREVYSSEIKEKLHHKAGRLLIRDRFWPGTRTAMTSFTWKTGGHP